MSGRASNGTPRGELRALKIAKVFERSADGVTFDEALRGLRDLLVKVGRGPRRASIDVELRAQPLVRWLCRRLPVTMRAAPADPAARLRFVADLLSAMIQADVAALAPAGRADKQRAAAIEAVCRVEAALADGLTGMSKTKAAALAALLGDAKVALAAPRNKPVAHPALLVLGRGLALADVEPKARAPALAEIAALVGVEVDGKTIRRYAAQADKIGGQAAKIHLRNPWHVLDEIR